MILFTGSIAEANVLGIRRLARIATDRSPGMVHAGTGSAYGTAC
jgi:hypothetical protein